MAAVIGVAALAATHPASAARPWRRPAHAAAATARQAALTPERYRSALAPVRDCAAFFARIDRLPDARPLLRALFADGVPVKSAIETPDSFVARVVAHLFARLGDPSRIHLSLAVNDAARYDASRGVLVVPLPQPFEVMLDRTPGAETRATGAAPPARTATELRAGFDFPADALPRPLAVPMTADQAARFKAGGGRLHILSLLEDYGTDATPPATNPAGSVALVTSFRLVRLTPKCAILGNFGVPVGGWDYDGWPDPPPAG